jgi:cytochrome P450
MPYRFDLARFSDIDDPFPTYDDLRSRGPICRAGGNQWLVLSYRDVARHLKNPSLEQFQLRGVLRQFPASSELQTLSASPAAEFTQRILAGLDGSEHKALRQVMAVALRPAFARLEDIVREEAARLIAGLRGRASLDAIPEIAFPFPLAVMGRLVGVPEAWREAIGRDCLALAEIFKSSYTSGERSHVDEALARLRERIGELIDRGLRDRKSSEPAPTFVARFAELAGDEYARDTLIDNTIFLLFAGFETSLNLIADAFDALLDFPDQAALLSETPDMMPGAIDEFLRYRSPVHFTGRLTVAPVVIAGQSIAPGRVIYLGLASANRDPDEFPEPSQLRLDRSPNRHVAFGDGPHQCLGTAIARKEAEGLFRAFVEAFPRIERAGPARRVCSFTFRTLTTLPFRIA